MSNTKRYAFAVASVVLALIRGLLLQHFKFHDVELPLLLFAVALTAWHVGRNLQCCRLCSRAFRSIISSRRPFTLTITPADIPATLVLISCALLVTSFAAARRRIEAELLRARDRLQAEVAERTQQASLLNLTHDTIFVRDTNDVITYWNRGAEELYSWQAGEAVGRSSRDLLQTVLPGSIDIINAELEQTGRWVLLLPAEGAASISNIVCSWTMAL